LDGSLCEPSNLVSLDCAKMALMYLTKSRERFSISSLLSPKFFYFLAVLAVVTSALSVYTNLRSEKNTPKNEPVTEEIDSNEKALTKAEDKVLPKTTPQPELNVGSEPTPTPKTKPTPKPLPASTVTRKVLVLDFDPIVNGQRLHNLLGWENPQALETQFVVDVKSASGNYVNYQIVEHRQLDDFPVLNSGFDFDGDSFLDCWNDLDRPESKCHTSVGVDYNKLLTDYGSDVCAARNSGAIHEVWVWGGPYFGFYESRLAGPGAFEYNSPPLTGTSCNKQLPIMGFSYERGVAEMLEDLGHRTEAAMSHTYGGWAENRTSHNWDRFGLVKAQSPDYDYSGCGSVHYAPNSLSDYDWSRSSPAKSTCQDWLNYPYLTGATQQIGCSSWGCSGYGYLKWWFSHLPHFTGVAPDGKWNNWWRYVLDYKEATALNPWQELLSRFLVFWGNITTALRSGFGSAAFEKN